jgi:DNA-binding MarR family transcriptional regulator
MNTIQITSDLLKDQNVNSTEVRIYCFLQTQASDSNLSEVTNKLISDELGISLKTVTRSMAVLEGEGYIDRKQERNIRYIYFTGK